MRKRVVIGTPINPMRYVEQLVNSSFCLSFFYREKLEGQLGQFIRLTGEDEILLLDNGAFSFWKRRGRNATGEYWADFERWAHEVMKRCPQAVAIIPDVIDGGVEENALLVRDFLGGELPMDRLMPVWHLGEPVEYLEHLLESGFRYIAFGSSGQYRSIGTADWHDRIAQAFAVVDHVCTDEAGLARPWVHMLRAQSMAHLYPFDSSDSTNIAVNHGRYRGRANHLRNFAGRVRGRIERSGTVADKACPGEAAIEARWNELIDHWLTGASEEELRRYFVSELCPIVLSVPDYRCYALPVASQSTPDSVQLELFG